MDTNFAKIDRIDHDGIEAFKASVLASKHRGRTNKEWQRLLKNLGNDDDPLEQKRAELVITEIYDEL